MATTTKTKTEKKAAEVKPISHANIYDALEAAKDDFPVFYKNNEVSFGTTNYSFVDLRTILEKTRPILKKHGLAVIQTLDAILDKPALKTVLRHGATSEEIVSLTVLTLAKQDPQAGGSAITYFRRYSYVTMLELKTSDIEDDDGRQATFEEEEIKEQKKEKPLKEVAKDAVLISDAQMTKLCLAPSQAKLTKEEASEFWGKIKTKLGLTRGKFDPNTKTWSGTNITDEDSEVIMLRLSQFVERIRKEKEEAIAPVVATEESETL